MYQSKTQIELPDSSRRAAAHVSPGRKSWVRRGKWNRVPSGTAEGIGTNGDKKQASLQPPYNLLKHLSALLIILELIEARASWSQQHYITRLGYGIGLAQSVFQSFGVYDLDIFNLRLNLPRRRADRISPLHPLPQQVVEHTVVTTFILAAKNEVDVRRKRLQRLNRRIHVRGLRIVVIVHAADRRHKLQPVLNRLKIAHRLPDLLRRASHQHAHASRIILVQHREVAFLLVLKHPRLRIYVSLKRPMPIQMVRRNVQYHRDLGSERLNGLQLKARDFQHNHALRLRPLRQRNRRSANVSADECRQPSRSQNLSRERSRRSLPIRTGNRHNRSWQKLRRQLNLADHWLAQRPCLRQQRRVHRNTRAHHNQILSAKGALAVPAGLDRNPMIE